MALRQNWNLKSEWKTCEMHWTPFEKLLGTPLENDNQLTKNVLERNNDIN